MASHLIDDELLIIEDGGEMPEVTFHSCLYFLQADPDGPRLEVGAEDLLRLKQAVIQGYRKIIIRDLTVGNRDKGLYRGLARCAANWQRLSRYCQREGFNTASVAAELRPLIHHFFAVECAEVAARSRPTCINCSLDVLRTFFDQVGFDQTRLPAGWEALLCRG